jgi:hypothetical protein
MLPLHAKLKKLVGKAAGDEVSVGLERRFP